MFTFVDALMQRNYLRVEPKPSIVPFDRELDFKFDSKFDSKFDPKACDARAHVFVCALDLRKLEKTVNPRKPSNIVFFDILKSIRI